MRHDEPRLMRTMLPSSHGGPSLLRGLCCRVLLMRPASRTQARTGSRPVPPPLWIVPNNALSLSLSRSGAHPGRGCGSEVIRRCVLFATVLITKLFAWGKGDSGGHVLRGTTSRGLCGLVFLDFGESPEGPKSCHTDAHKSSRA
jgi:hypothetical protein